MARLIPAAAIAAALAGSTLVSVPTAAAPTGAASVPPSLFAFSRPDATAAGADYHCRWRCRGWGGGWRRGGWRRDRVDAGDVILGAAIIGGIAAILSADNRRDRDRDVIVYDRDRRDRTWVRRDERRARPLGSAASGLDNAAAMCVDTVERDARVASVDKVERDATGWVVSGALATGSSFTCRIGNDGRILDVDYGEAFAGAATGGQWSEEAYAAARGALGGTVRPDMAVQEASVQGGAVQVARAPVAAGTQPMPAYPGGPIPGEEIPENPPEPLSEP